MKSTSKNKLWMSNLYHKSLKDSVIYEGEWPEYHFFHDRPLYKITLPGTHDSGCYCEQWGSSFWSMTQLNNIFTQLSDGIRYFDIRPYYTNDDFLTYHGLFYSGGKITGENGILEQIKKFFESLTMLDRELVLINVSHFYNFTDELHERLIKAIVDVLGDYLLDYTQANLKLFDTQYWQLLSKSENNAVPQKKDEAKIRSRVVVLYDGALDTKKEQYVERLLAKNVKGFFVLSPKYNTVGQVNNPIYLFDQYSNAANVGDGYLFRGMRSDQLDKLRQREKYQYNRKDYEPANWVANAVGGVPGILHLLSWTLTPQLKSIYPSSNCPLLVAQNYTNPTLLDLFCNRIYGWDKINYDRKYDPMINIIYVDNYASEIYTDRNSAWFGYAIPVAIAARMNVGSVNLARDN